jgi:hypothetical protein
MAQLVAIIDVDFLIIGRAPQALDIYSLHGAVLRLRQGSKCFRADASAVAMTRGIRHNSMAGSAYRCE